MTVADNSTTNTIDRGALVSDNNLSTTFFWSGTGATGNFQRGTISAENIDIAAHKIALQGIEIKVLAPQKQGSENFEKKIHLKIHCSMPSLCLETKLAPAALRCLPASWQRSYKRAYPFFSR